ncbi:AbaSI family restriction endonuclease [Zhongshania aliphaticivorans]|uniref:AbaSI family restriction endonuclease n=1 Tax=Zhongshania aliphaticivorans TaxID=1470434 RepID=UPI0012E46340|nr:hypothetical protein [Zhongshania aliphaticivorans]CAA0120424.1 Uncharacterised protein [Zhongshania aliphaticivorans]
MDKKEYIVRQLARTKHKKYEQYVVSRIIHLLNDFDIKFITQQHVARPQGRALTDLFFPQFGYHVEVLEGQHFYLDNIESDKMREADIINATGHTFREVAVECEIVDDQKRVVALEDINGEIDKIVFELKELSKSTDFVPWDIDAEMNPETYIKRGFVDTKDDVFFRTIKDACNCFGHSYKVYQRAGAKHPEGEAMLWFPKLYKNDEWDNQISRDEETITEKAINDDINVSHVGRHLDNPRKHKNKRIVFARVRGSLGDVFYRFRGVYQLDRDQSNNDTGLVWRRVGTRAVTFEPGVEFV